jgi:menaquinone-specific isochorismate synthase
MAETASGFFERSAVVTRLVYARRRRLLRVSQTPLHGLIAESVALSEVPDVLALISPENPLLWWRRGAGMVGFGTAVTLEFSGPGRIDAASAAWASLVASSTVLDDVAVPGSGLIAWGTFAFRKTSSFVSRLIVPRFIVGTRDGVGWFTRIRPASEQADALTPAWAQATVLQLSTAAQAASAAPRTAVTFSAGQLSEADFSTAVSQAVARIESGSVEKVVLARDITGTFAGTPNLAPSLRHLVDSYPDCWSFAVDGLFGSSPETLVSVHHDRVSARVLAGTARRGNDGASDLASAAALASSPKDLDEHGFATRSVIESLAPFTTELTASDSPFTLKLPNLWHLATDISAKLTGGSSSLDLVSALHPTAAVAGTPMKVAVEVIDELEPFDRGRYAGPVGWIGADGDGEWAIALRCAQVVGDRVTAYAGGGIVADSIPEMELAETKMKFRPIVDALS